ncbi:SusC/RagA family TonB-linked outer membrane protein [Olivibacter jilunii]|uniref:SusC/RagA family TonB-linked outer membrane protein n=1 Tax=Olivibacter jilunii TaxID=985016 RepID=UPI0010307871|nr:SusC/RagA family TonB-linked outer membrane protein [Olivibacter jilunii]
MARKILKIICLTMVLSVFMPPKLIKLMAASSESFSPSFQTVSLEEALKKLEEKFHVSIAYRSGLLKNNQIDMSVLQHASTIEAALSSALADRKLSFKKNNDRFFVIIEKNIPSEIAAAQSKPVNVQQRSVRGVVTDEQGQPIPFAAVKIKGTTLVTSTNEKGQFVINNLPPDAILIITYMGYRPTEVPVSGKAEVNLQMEPVAAELNEVVVVGYGVQRKEEFTGSATRIGGEKLADQPVQSFDQALAGRASGVNIAQPNGVLNNAPVIRIRGVNSISQSSYPLIVVDGIPINAGESVSSNANVTNNPLGDINPADIESVNILKDAASTSIYGSRGAAGVMIITTKRGKTGKARVNYEGWTGISNPVRLPTMLNAAQFMEIKNEAVLNSKILSGNADNDNVASAYFFPTYKEDGSLVDTRWYDETYRTGFSHNHSLNVTGGSEDTKYFFSTNYSDQKGFIRNNEFDRIGVRFNVDHNLTNWLKLTGGANYTRSNNQSPNTGSLRGNAFLLTGIARLAWLTAPNVSPYNPDGTYNIASSTNSMGMGNNTVVSNFYNPTALLGLNRYDAQNDHIIGNVGATVTLLKGLDFKTSYALDWTKVENKTFESALHGPGFTPQGNAVNTINNINTWNWSNTMSFRRAFGQHNLSLLGGYEVQHFYFNRWGATRTQVSDEYYENFEGSYGRIIPFGSMLDAESSLISYISRINYDFDKRYFLTINFRRDGNSILGEKTKFGNFGGASIGWTLSEENFYKGSSLAETLNSIKLRGSWGRVGNANNPNKFASLNLYESALYGDAPMLNYYQAGNSGLEWETSDQTNIGADLGFFNDRLQVEMTYFYNNVNGLILNAPQTPSKGIPNNGIMLNVGSMYNRGFEFTFNARVLEQNGFTWNSSFNFTTIKNRVTALAEGNADIVGSTSTAAEATNITRVGYSVGSLYGAKTDGVNPETGQRIFINRAGERVQYSHAVAAGESRWTYLDGSPAQAISGADYYLLGNALPTWYGGFDNTLQYKNFDLNLSFVYSGGNYIQNGTKATLRDQRFWNNYTEIYDRWTSPGQQTDIPRLVYGDVISNGSSYPISENVEKADFLRLQTASLGYRLPTKLLGKSGISSVRFYGQVFNAFIITGYSGSDPALSSNGNDNLTPGVDKNSVPQARTFTLGVNVGF